MIGSPWDEASPAPVSSVNGQQGDVVLTAEDVGADATGAADAAISAHVGAADPHPGYPLRSERGAANGYAGLDGDGKVVQEPASASATPTANAIARASAGGKLDAWITAASTSAQGLVQLAADAEAASNKAVSGTDSRLANARAPTAHAASHQNGGSDEIATASATANAIPKASAAGKLDSGWGGAANTLATLDGSTLVPTAQQGTGSADSTKFLRGDRTWATALQGGLGSTDNALVRADGTGGLTAQGSNCTLDDSGNLKLANRGLTQPIAPSAWSGSTSNHDLPIPSWATTTGKYTAYVRVRVQQNATTTSFHARTHQVELTYNGSAWSLDGTVQDPAIGALAVTMGWSISSTNLRLALSGLGGGNSGNVGMLFLDFVYYGAL